MECHTQPKHQRTEARVWQKLDKLLDILMIHPFGHRLRAQSQDMAAPTLLLLLLSQYRRLSQPPAAATSLPTKQPSTGAAACCCLALQLQAVLHTEAAIKW
jgi:hypothetical protein